MAADPDRLTEAEYGILVDAWAYYETVIEDDPRKVATLNRAGDKLIRWYRGKAEQ